MNTGLLPCPYCGSPADKDPNYDQVSCSASSLVLGGEHSTCSNDVIMTTAEWNKRAIQGQPVFDTCGWKDMASRWEEPIWHTACEHDFTFTIGGTPETNEFTFCPYCGRRIEVQE